MKINNRPLRVHASIVLAYKIDSRNGTIVEIKP